VGPFAGLLLLLCCAAQAEGPDAAQRRSAAVSGHGEVDATPDRARLSMSVEVTKPDLKAAQAEANRIVRDYLAQARSLGAKDEDISTAGLSIRADYDYSGSNGRKFLGYHISRGVTVVVRDLDHVGDFLQHATDAGINNVSEPQLESSLEPELRRQALARAAADAQENARTLAQALGVKLGTVRTISSSVEASRPRPMVMMKAMAAPAAPSGNEEMGFAAGELHYDAEVTADFDLTP
jgi:uncharacterized protein YggE